MYGCQNEGVFIKATKSFKKAVLNQKLHKTPKNYGKFSSRGLELLKSASKRGKNRHEIYPFLDYGCQNEVLYFEAYITKKTFWFIELVQAVR